MIASLIEMLELPNLWVTWLKFFDDVMNIYHDVIIFISKYLYFKRARVANFADIIKTATIFIKTTFNLRTTKSLKN